MTSKELLIELNTHRIEALTADAWAAMADRFETIESHDTCLAGELRIISTDLKGAGHDLNACIVDKSGLSDADVLRWHFGKVTEYGFGGWWIWCYQDTEGQPTGLRDLEGRWKSELIDAIRERTRQRRATKP